VGIYLSEHPKRHPGGYIPLPACLPGT